MTTTTATTLPMLALNHASRAAWVRATDRAFATALDERVRLIPEHRPWELGRYTVPSTSEPGVEHTVIVWCERGRDPLLGCDCTAGRHGRVCRHMGAVVINQRMSHYLRADS